MRKITAFQKLQCYLLLALTLLLFTQSSFQPSIQTGRCNTNILNNYNPAIDIKDLFNDVQLSGIFPDSKTFTDYSPAIPSDSIRYYYEIRKGQPSFDMKLFIGSYFKMPAEKTHKDPQDLNSDLAEHLNSLWPTLRREPDTITNGTLIPLSNPYIVPGGRFREIYYWDSYFTMEGLAASGQIDLIHSMLNNFSCMIQQYGYIPNGNRTYFLGRSQPPFFAEMIKLYMRETSDNKGLEYLPALEREYQFWMGPEKIRKIPPEKGYLNYYSDQNLTPRPEAYKEDTKLALIVAENKRELLYSNIRAACESGWDFSSRWMADGSNLQTIHTIEILPVDLNCLLFNMELTLAELYKLAGNMAFATSYYKKADDRKQLIKQLFWNNKKGFYYDYDIKTKKLCTSECLAGVYPLYFKISGTNEANQVANKLRKEFLKDGGLVTTMNNTGQQWDSPNGWAPLQWMAIVGLENYGFKSLADSIAHRWMALNEKVYRDTGKMMEKYNVVDTTLEAGGGEYPGQDGFGWTNGVYLALKKKGY